MRGVSGPVARCSQALGQRGADAGTTRFDCTFAVWLCSRDAYALQAIFNRRALHDEFYLLPLEDGIFMFVAGPRTFFSQFPIISHIKGVLYT